MTVHKKLIERIQVMDEQEAEQWLERIMENKPFLCLSGIIRESLSNVSPEEWVDAPTDLAERHDYYAYGLLSQ
jgi:hypothetical protein